MNLTPTLRIVVCDPQPVFRYGLTQLFHSTDHLRVVGEAANTFQALDALQQSNADVLVITTTGDGSSLNGLSALSALSKSVRCVFVTDVKQTPPVDVNVAGTLPRESPARAFVDCLELLARDPQRTGSAAPAGNVAAAPSAKPAAAKPAATTPAARYRLTPRETQIVAAVADGSSNKDIASQLSISEDTVKHHLSNVFDKVGVHSRLELAVFALYHGVVTMGGGS
jgi:two-component system, NarL family, nitrate/nitrite response regulator NarL